MNTRNYLRAATILGAAGVAFSGYLSWTRMTSGICAFSEPCPFFFGYPACYTGFALFAIAFVASVTALVGRASSSWPMIVNTLVGTAGVLFAGAMTVEELSGHNSYRLGLPTCAYGFVFFVALAVISIAAWVRRTRPRQLALHG